MPPQKAAVAVTYAQTSHTAAVERWSNVGQDLSWRIGNCAFGWALNESLSTAGGTNLQLEPRPILLSDDVHDFGSVGCLEVRGVLMDLLALGAGGGRSANGQVSQQECLRHRTGVVREI